MKEYLKNQKIEERKTGKSQLVRTIKKIAALSIPVLALTAFVKIREDYLSAPISKTYANLNGDNRKDLIVQTRRGEVFEFIQMEDGRYKLLYPEEKKEIEKQAREQFYLENNIPFSSSKLD